MGGKHRTIYICDSFGLAGGRDKDLEMLRRCHAHLEEGGALLLNVQMEHTTPAAWEMWLKEKHGELPQPWPEEGRAHISADGSENVARFRYLEINPLEQSYTRQVRLEKRRAGALIPSKEYTLRGDMYLKHEVLLMHKVAGFRQNTVQSDYTEKPRTVDSEELIFTAIR